MRRFTALAALTAVITLVGCVSQQVDLTDGAAPADGSTTTSQKQTEHATSDAGEEVLPAIDDSLSEPPALSLLAGGETFTLRSGNYNWSVPDGELTTETIACGASPVQNAASGHAVTIPADSEPQLMLPHGAEISEVLVWKNDSTKTSAEFTDDGLITPSDNSVGIVYSVNVKFPQGKAEYVFVIEDALLCGLPTVEAAIYAEDGLYHPTAHIHRTDGYIDGKMYPYTVTISTADELGQYISENSTQYNISDEVFAPYDSEFFETRALVIAVLEEGSGSVRHEFAGIDRENTIRIRRLVPEVGTCDMAEYHVVIEVFPQLSEAEFTVEFIS